jgi:redox-sensitive bicupin YhaK (pirin superfamily)
MNRRTLLGAIASAPVVAACDRTPSALLVPNETRLPMTENVVRNAEPLGFPWRTPDPFLFCVHHDDAYPVGNAALGPAASLRGRNLGSDFANVDGWNMYHGDVVPGFPQHPHRGFETVTVVRKGLIDHSDSLGAKARYGGGDTQWLTAGKGIVHAEMFPLLSQEEANPAELFQIWLNLPRADKMVDPYFTMLWRDSIPKRTVLDAAGKATELTVVAGRFDDARAPSPPPHSWAHRPENEVAIWTLKLAPGARFTLPAVSAGTNRTLYFFRGSGLRVGDRAVAARHLVELRESVPATLVNGDDEGEVLLLQGRAIGEPVAQHGPFVMNTRAEIQQAFADYQRTRFGGWPWPSDGPVHGPAPERFAQRADGVVERG